MIDIFHDELSKITTEKIKNKKFAKISYLKDQNLYLMAD